MKCANISVTTKIRKCEERLGIGSFKEDWVTEFIYRYNLGSNYSLLVSLSVVIIRLNGISFGSFLWKITLDTYLLRTGEIKSWWCNFYVEFLRRLLRV